MKHTLRRNYKKYPDIEMRIIKDIIKILPNSYYIGPDVNTKKETSKHVKGVHNFYDIVVFEKEMYEVWFKVKETADKTYFYDHGIIRKI